MKAMDEKTVPGSRRHKLLDCGGEFVLVEDTSLVLRLVNLLNAKLGTYRLIKT